MANIKNKIKKIYIFAKDKRMIFWGILFVGAFMRLYSIESIPNGVNPDEAYAAYNAYSILNYGVDSFGYHNPVYFVAWGSGMNVLNSYLMIPFIKIFGLHIWVIRLPQLLLSCMSLIFFYLLVKRVLDKNKALLSMFLLAICPWHIMMSRNNIESGLLPAFFLIGLYFFIKGLENSKFLYASAVSYGLCLYSYAIIWPILPIIILLQGIYSVKYKKLRLKDKHLWISCTILVVMAIPLLLFLLVNYEFIDEIKTTIISIPRMVQFRSSDISISNIPQNMVNLFNMLSSQQDGLNMNSTDMYGLYYKFSNVFIIIGACILCGEVYKCMREKRFSLQTIVLLQLSLIVLLGLVIQNPHATRVNCIHFFMLLLISVGITSLANKYFKPFTYIMIVVYIISFLSFVKFYRTSYNISVYDLYQRGINWCVEDAMKADGNIYIDSRISFSVILYYSQMPVQEFIDTVQYDEYPSAYLDAKTYGRFITLNLKDDMELKDYNSMFENGTYIMDSDYEEKFEKMGYNVSVYGDFCVAVK